MNPKKILFFSAVVLATLSLSRAADIVGKWTSEFDSPIGRQKYSYEFKMEEGKITGKAAYDHSMGKGESVLKNLTVVKDDVSFVENMKIQDNEITITYTGKLSGDEMKLSRTVGDYGTEELVAKRAKTEMKPATEK